MKVDMGIEKSKKNIFLIASVFLVLAFVGGFFHGSLAAYAAENHSEMNDNAPHCGMQASDVASGTFMPCCFEKEASSENAKLSENKRNERADLLIDAGERFLDKKNKENVAIFSYNKLSSSPNSFLQAVVKLE